MKISLLASLNTTYVPIDGFLSSVQQDNVLTASLEENARQCEKEVYVAGGAVLRFVYSERIKCGNCSSFETGL
jgi:hypothetical protein